MNESYVSIAETVEGRQYWCNRPYVSDEAKVEIGAASLVILPKEGFRDHLGPVFPVGTEELLRYLQSELPGDVPVGIAVDEDKYVELALHGALVIIGTFLVTAIAAPVVANIISEYIKKRWGSKQETTNVRVELRIEDVERTSSISFEGPAEQFLPTTRNAIQVASQSSGNKSPILPSGDNDDNR